ncbi:hypothetical protein EVAR_14282_1 [Eumeta japonica]|uniref:Uncharacterized protein n=1 Tax=Eumeta variegata TaxID=151549 RepID=A0A4C1ULY9_EUMVA|nr:hypothetical protein EVAR_14282_1 [Eumeta japonica]
METVGRRAAGAAAGKATVSGFLRLELLFVVCNSNMENQWLDKKQLSEAVDVGGCLEPEILCVGIDSLVHFEMIQMVDLSPLRCIVNSCHECVRFPYKKYPDTSMAKLFSGKKFKCKGDFENAVRQFFVFKPKDVFKPKAWFYENLREFAESLIKTIE